MFSKKLTTCLGLSFFVFAFILILWQAQNSDRVGLSEKFSLAEIKKTLHIQPEKPLDVDFYHNDSQHDPEYLEILNSTLGFEKIFAISLPSRSDHRDKLTIAGSATGLHFEYVNGVYGKDVHKSNVPSDHKVEDEDLGALGAWRAHLDALERIVARNLSSALITEDDVDWDVRIKAQMQSVAAGTRTILQPQSIQRRDDERINIDAPLTETPHITPYGDEWDLLWLGYCRMQPPLIGDNWLRKARYIIFNDATVPSYKHYHPHEPRIQQEYPEHTRVVSYAKMGLCSLAYAVTQQGARRILHQMTEDKFRAAFDVMLYEWCEHGYDNTCLTTFPQVFNHYRAAGSAALDSDLRGPQETDEFREKAETVNIRYSTMQNIDKLLTHQTDFEDQYPD